MRNWLNFMIIQRAVISEASIGLLFAVLSYGGVSCNAVGLKVFTEMRLEP
jgi:hypothetical protein